MKFLLTTALLVCPVFAGEYVELASGATLHIDRHETDGSVVRLITGGGSIEMSASQVRRFESDGNSPASAEPAQPAAGQPSPSGPEIIRKAALDSGLPEALLHSVIAAESGYRPRVVSPKGAIGLMQLMPGTARERGVDPYDPAQNVQAGAQYLRELLLKYRNQAHLALAAYNAGPAAVDKYGTVPPYRETRDYVSRVISRYQKLNK